MIIIMLTYMNAHVHALADYVFMYTYVHGSNIYIYTQCVTYTAILGCMRAYVNGSTHDHIIEPWHDN